MPSPTEFRRLAVPEVVRPYVGFRGLIVLVLAVVVALWLRQNIAEERGATMQVVPEQALRVVDLPLAVPVITPAPSPIPNITGELTEDERQRRLDAQAAQPAPDVPGAAPDLPTSVEAAPGLEEGR